ncbi:MAG: hypothetical protein U5L95_00110 [Candidatus Saccharibacteria bacterium]|nr:hypothetical protein [Candidatus Saccharibacteria bacterium]
MQTKSEYDHAFAVTFNQFAATKREYDDNVAVDKLRDPSYVEPHLLRLEDIDLDVPYDLQPERMARSALALYIHREKINDAVKDSEAVENAWSQAVCEREAEFAGAKVRISCLDGSPFDQELQNEIRWAIIEV